MMKHDSDDTKEITMKMHVDKISPLTILACLCACVITASACGGDDPETSMTPDQGSATMAGEAGGPCYGNGTCNTGLRCVDALCELDTSTMQDMGGRDAGQVDMTPSDMSAQPDLAATDMEPVDMGAPDASEDMAQPAREEVLESEPNNGDAIEEVDTFTTSQIARGSIETPGDIDIWKVDMAPGEIYRIKLEAGDDSRLWEHLSVIDAGRGDDVAGEDYVKIAEQFDGDPHATLTLFTMGQGGYYLIVRDARNVGPQMSQEGSAAHTYSLYLEKLTPADVQGKSLGIEAGDITDALSSPGDINIYPFTAALNDELVADLQAADPAQLDARLFVYAEQEQSWIARQDNRTVDNADPLLDAPLFANGQMWLIVENITPTATSLAYTLKTRLTKP